MRGLIIAVVVILVLLLVGWLRFGAPDGNPTLQIDTEEIKEDTSSAVERGKAAIDQVQQEVDEEVEEEAAEEAREEQIEDEGEVEAVKSTE